MLIWVNIKNCIAWHPTPVLLPGKSHGRRSLVGCSPWGLEESDTTERLHFHFSLSCIGEGNGNPLQGSCLENPRAGRVWWAAVYGVAQSQTRLRWLSRSSSGSSSEHSWGCTFMIGELLNIVVVQLLSCVWLFATPWTATRQASLFFTIISQSLLKLMLNQWCPPSFPLLHPAPPALNLP